MTNHNIDHIVGQLVGPAAPEASCEECFDRLDVYVDREVLVGDADVLMPALAAHLRGCPACAEDHESLRAFVCETHPRPEPGATP